MKIVKSLSKTATKRGLFGIAVCLMSAVFLSLQVEKTNFHGDESGWISSGRYYTHLLATADFRREKWECAECEGWGSLNMQVGKWLIGIPLELDQQSRDEAFSRYYDFKTSIDENVKKGLLPPRHTLNYARGASAIFGVFCCLLVFSLGCYVCNAFVGTIAATLVLFNSLFISLATRAMADVHYNFFLLCFALTIVRLVAVSDRKQALTLSGLCGLFAGLACSVKITGIVIGTASFLLAAGQRVWFGRSGKETALYQVGIFACSAFLIIYGLNPYFWPSPRKLWNAAVFQELRSISGEVISTKHLPSDVRTRYPHIGTLTYMLEFPRLFGRWNNVMYQQQNWPSASWHGRRFMTLNSRLFFADATFPGQVILLATGIIAVTWKRFRDSCSIPLEATLACLQYFAVNYLFILAFMRLNWSRYYLPTLIAGSLVAAIGGYALILQSYRFASIWKRASDDKAINQP
jgi:hypothetical protein